MEEAYVLLNKKTDTMKTYQEKEHHGDEMMWAAASQDKVTAGRTKVGGQAKSRKKLMAVDGVKENGWFPFHQKKSICP